MNKREEAIRRLEILERKGMIETAKQLFIKKDTIPVFERIAPTRNIVYGTLFSLEEVNEFPEYQEYDLKEMIENFEKSRNAVVYLATTEKAEFGLLIDLFYVTKYEEEWPMDIENLKNNRQLVYTYNLTNPYFSERGTIRFSVKFGGVLRTE